MLLELLGLQPLAELLLMVMILLTWILVTHLKLVRQSRRFTFFLLFVARYLAAVDVCTEESFGAPLFNLSVTWSLLGATRWSEFSKLMTSRRELFPW